MMLKKNGYVSRRSFLSTAGKFSLAGAIAPTIIPATAIGKSEKKAPSDRVAMGFIGVGHQGSGHLLGGAWTYFTNGYVGRDDVQVLAICDVLQSRRVYNAQRVNRYYDRTQGEGNYPRCKFYADFRQLLERKDIDAVLIATPIHWHATQAVFSAQAGKDIYCEKPTAVSIHEAQALVKAVLENKRVYQAGTQQRSEYEGKFRIACELIRNGRIGKLQEVYAFRDGGGVAWPTTYGETKPIPEELDWDLWLGPAPMMPFQGRHDAHLFGTGGINWGQHHYDIVQWALDADKTGPIKLDLDQGNAVYQYANGVTVYGRPYPESKISETGGAWFIGSEGKIGVDRTNLVSEPESIVKEPIKEGDLHLYRSDSHSGNFLECVKTRKKTICNVEIAHRSASVMLLGGIVKQVKRPLTWDPDKELFVNDDEANKLLRLSKREPWIV
jgi:predicted dehydrogenase